MSVWLELTGWVGALSVLIAYILLSAKKLPSDSYAYHALNILGSGLLVVYTLWKAAFASTLVNVIWFGVGLLAIASLWRAQRQG